ncbi:flagellar basal body P-ring formation chaperone FlgA [Halovulum sp. GXIMD14793]
MRWTLIILLLAGSGLQAQSLIANRAIPAKSVITETDVALTDQTIPGAYRSIVDAVGLEARVSIYPGRPVRMGDLGPPAIVERNDIVKLRFVSGALTIEAEGRAMERAGIGDFIRVMNLSSRTTITGRVTESGVIEVGR